MAWNNAITKNLQLIVSDIFEFSFNQKLQIDKISYLAKMQNDIRVESWEELQRELFRETWDPGLQRFRSPYVYRGLSSMDYELKTSLLRLGGPIQLLEKHLLRNFRKYAYKDAGKEFTFWNWLAVAQHYGLPTRLLDWTYSPYIASHFATAGLHHYKEDGAIWAVNYVKLTEHLPFILKNALQEEGSNVFTAEILSPVCNSFQDFDSLQRENFVLFLEPPNLDARIMQQHALFSCLSSPNVRLDEWLQNHPSLYFRIIIPAELKWEIRDKLDQANITERVLFPGLNGLSTWLKRHYSPKI